MCANQSGLQMRQAASTLAVHGGVDRDKSHHAIATPIYQTSTYTFSDTADLLDFFAHKNDPDVWREQYGRYGNPSLTSVERKLAVLDSGDDAVLFPSGMAAVTSVLIASLRVGAHIIMTDDCYRRTRQFCEEYLSRLGVETSVVPMSDYTAMEAAIQPGKTRYIISESPTNPYLRVADLEQLARLGKQYGIRTMIDSTFATPINQRPLEWGIDLVVHSGTKYLGGHNDLLAGVVVGKGGFIGAIRESRGILGGVLDPQSAFLLERGLKTLALRVRQQNETAQALATFLESHPKVERVWYPGLESHPDYAIAATQMDAFGGVVSFEVAGDLHATSRFVDATQIPYIAPSLGGTESLICQIAYISYHDKSAEERAALGIRDNLVRFAVGVEDSPDIIADVEQALRVV